MRTLFKVRGTADPLPTTTETPKRGAKTLIGPLGCASDRPNRDATTAARIGCGPVATEDAVAMIPPQPPRPQP
jgi:hypothetical protein